MIPELLQRISESPTPRACDVDPTISRELDAVCATAMSKKRDERYLDAKALAADVKRSLAHQPVSVYRTGAWERLRLWRRRNPVVESLSLFLAVSLLTGSVVSTLFGLEAKRERAKAVKLFNANATLAEQEKSAREKSDLNAERERKERGRADDETRRAQRLLYAAKMNLAQAAWENNHVGRLRELLTETRPQSAQRDLRGFEWYYWNHLAHSYQMNLEGHTDAVRSVAFSADGKRLASASHDQTVKVWDVTSGQETLSLNGHTGSVMSVVFSEDGKWLASAGADQTVKVWDSTSGQETLTLKGNASGVYRAEFSADGQRLASVSGNGIMMWDARPWTPELREEREALSLIHSLRAQGQSPIEWLAAIAADQTLTELRRGGPTRPPIRPRMEITQGLAIQNSELAERDYELGEGTISANCEL